MKELDALMKALDEKGISKSLRFTAKLCPFPKHTDTPEKKQELLDKAVKECLLHHIAEDEELRSLYFDFINEVGMKALIEKLDIKAPEESPDIGEFLEKLLIFLKNF